MCGKQERLRLCAEGRLLLVSPWRYEYRGRDGAVTEQLCKTMNAVAQALCRLGDGWWMAGPALFRHTSL